MSRQMTDSGVEYCGNALLPGLDDEAFQGHFLEGVSRTFALTIPQLPAPLCFVVSNAYLLCRVVDTIEDEPALRAGQKRAFCERFQKVVDSRERAESFAGDLFPFLSEETSSEERELIGALPRVISITHGFERRQRAILQDCVRVMTEGMVRFQRGRPQGGFRDLAEMDRYCYFVAGVVGEMLTRLFCHHSARIGKRRDELMRLAVSFGQGLQMTNILKDIWDDRDRSACWLPRDVFEKEGIDLEEIGQAHTRDGFSKGLELLIGIAHRHLIRALSYSLLIPKRETGIRRFCLWNIGMAVLTLRNINANRTFKHGHEVKISRGAVKATFLVTNMTITSDLLLKSLFCLAAMRLPNTELAEST